MRTWKNIIKPEKDAAFGEYLARNTADAKCMYNVANFYIRNTMTGIKKSPEERTALETEVLHYVFTGIQKANADARARYEKKRKEYLDMKSEEGDSRAAKLKCTVFHYPTREKWFLSYNTLDAIFKATENPTYCRMNSQVNQNAIRKVVANWKGYFESLKEYKKHPEKQKACPGIPGYRKADKMTAAFSNQTARLTEQDGHMYLQFVKCDQKIPIGKASLYSGMKYVKTEVKPQYGNYTLLLTFDDGVETPKAPEHPERMLGVDLGVDNFVAVVNNFGDTPFLIKGGAVKTANQNFNKQRAHLISDLTKGSDSTRSRKNSRRLNAISQNRANFFRDFFYRVSWYLVRYAKKHDVEAIVVGHNEDQKQNINLGKQNNQNFVSVPFYQFLKVLRSIAAKVGIAVVIREESYTSKASLLDLDEIPTYQEGENELCQFSGKRIYRGLYRTDSGICLNADVNGAGNILRKEYPYAFDGQDLRYLYETTKVVSFTDLYPEAKSTCKERYNQKKHRPGPGSRSAHIYRKDIRMTYQKLWGKPKYVYKRKKSA